MATFIWRGDAQARRNVWHATPADMEIDDSFTLTINRKDVTVVATAATPANVVDLFVAAIAQCFDPEWQEVTAEAGVTGETTTHLILTGPSDGKPVTITGSTDGAGSLDVDEITEATGPNWFSEAENWDQNAVPGDGDTILFRENSVGCLYGLDCATTTPARIVRAASYTGQIGLSDWNGSYYEYRPTYWRVGDPNDSTTIEVELGAGEGAGGGRTKIDTGACQANITVWGTGSSPDDNPAFLWQGTHADNVMRVYKGSVGIAALVGEAAVLAALYIAYESSRDSDATVVCGEDVALSAVVKTGGSFVTAGQSGSAIGSFIQDAGEATLRGTDGVTLLVLRGGTCYYNSTGTLAGNPIVSGDAVLDFSRDTRVKTITNPIEVYGDEAVVNDLHGVVTNLRVDWNETTRLPGLGRNIRVTRGSVV